MPRSTRKESKTGICHLMLHVNTESPVHPSASLKAFDEYVEALKNCLDVSPM